MILTVIGLAVCLRSIRDPTAPLTGLFSGILAALLLTGTYIRAELELPEPPVEIEPE